MGTAGGWLFPQFWTTKFTVLFMYTVRLVSTTCAHEMSSIHEYSVSSEH